MSYFYGPFIYLSKLSKIVKDPMYLEKIGISNSPPEAYNTSF